MSEEELEKRKHRIIKRDVPAIKGILETIVDPDDLNGLAHQLTEVIAIGGNIATILPESQAILGHAKYNAMKMAKASNEKISPTELKMVVEGKTVEEQWIHEIMLELDRYCSKQIDALRTLISKGKTELEKGFHDANN